MRFPLLLCFLLLMVQCCLAEPLKREELAGRNVAIWQPVKTSKAPIVIFSHGFHGINSQSAHLMGVLAKAGYFVVAPNHGDYLFNKDGANSAPQQSFDSPRSGLRIPIATGPTIWPRFLAPSRPIPSTRKHLTLDGLC